MSTTVRKAGIKDLAPMTALLGELFSIEADFTPDAATQEAGLRMLLDGEKMVVFVAEAQEKVIGMATAQLHVSTAQGGLSALVEDLVVAEEKRGSGVGAKLLAEIEKWAREEGATRLQLVADKNNIPARKFYELSGWKQTDLIVLMKTKVGGNLCPEVRNSAVRRRRCAK